MAKDVGHGQHTQDEARWDTVRNAHFPEGASKLNCALMSSAMGMTTIRNVKHIAIAMAVLYCDESLSIEVSL